MTKIQDLAGWLSNAQRLVSEGRTIVARIDNDHVAIDDVTDAPPGDDPRWSEDEYNPIIDVGPSDLHPFDVMVALFAAVGIRAEPM